MIIVEGPDACGKSTLAKRIVEELDIPTHHFGGPPDTEKEAVNRCELILDQRGLVVFDRVIMISEPIYSLIRSSPNLLAKYEYIKPLLELNPLIIYCRIYHGSQINRLNRDQSSKDYKSEGHINQVTRHIDDLNKSYDYIMRSIPHLFYDFEKMPVEVILHHCKNHIRGTGHG